jgi:spore germination cell wall hydrolase CwlJ-like protein
MLKTPEYRQAVRYRQSWAEESFLMEEEEPRSAFAEYSPIVFGGMMLIAAFAFAGHYIGRNAVAHTADAAVEIQVPAVPQTTVLSSKSSLLQDGDTFQSVALGRLRSQTVLAVGKGDLFIPDAGEAPAPDSLNIIAKKKTSAEASKRIKIEPAAVNLKGENNLGNKAMKKLAAVAKPAETEESLQLSKAEKKKQLALRRIRQAEENCLARAVYFEARSESEMGQMAVAKVILNRVKDPNYPKSICGVVYQGSQRRNSCQFSFACDGMPDDVKSPAAWAQSKRVAQKAISGNLNMGKAMGQATNYHADYVRPRWAKSMRKLVKIGNHIFYTDG